MFSEQTYRGRRAALRGILSRSDERIRVVVFPGAVPSPRNYPANCHPFRQDSSFLYFFGVPRPGLDAVLDMETGEATLYGDEAGLEETVWTGPRTPLADEAAGAGAGWAPAAAFGTLLASHRSPGAVAYLPPYRMDTVFRLAGFLGRNSHEIARGWSEALVRAAVELRETKDEAEIAQLDEATTATVLMHEAAIAASRPGMTEAQIAAIAEERAWALGAGPSFGTIATVHGEVLHNTTRTGTLEPGRCLLLDAGAESREGYAGDLTSVFPCDPDFTGRQRDLYSLVGRAATAATGLLRPGTSFLDVHLAASRSIWEGLGELGLVRGDSDTASREGACALFFPHGVGHLIGLDVHDMEDYGEDLVGYGGEFVRSGLFGLRSLRFARRLKAGMAHTVEPGVYFIPGLVERWRSERRFSGRIEYGRLESWMDSGGFRYEEDWVVTESGARRLGRSFDRSIAAIEALRSRP